MLYDTTKHDWNTEKTNHLLELRLLRVSVTPVTLELLKVQISLRLMKLRFWTPPQRTRCVGTTTSGLQCGLFYLWCHVECTNLRADLLSLKLKSTLMHSLVLQFLRNQAEPLLSRMDSIEKRTNHLKTRLAKQEEQRNIISAKSQII